MFDWLRELYEIRADFNERRKHCFSCDRLETELARVNRENEILLQRLINPAGQATKPADEHEPVMIPPKRIPWSVRQQQLETKSRELAIQKNEEKRIAAEFQANLDKLKAQVKPVIIGDEQSQVEELERKLGISENSDSIANTNR